MSFACADSISGSTDGMRAALWKTDARQHQHDAVHSGSTAQHGWARGLTISTTGLTRSVKHRVQQEVEQAGGRYSADLSRSCTHLVLDGSWVSGLGGLEGAAQASEKLRCLLADRSTWNQQVVSLQWLLACRQAGCRVEEAAHLQVQAVPDCTPSTSCTSIALSSAAASRSPRRIIDQAANQPVACATASSNTSQPGRAHDAAFQAVHAEHAGTASASRPVSVAPGGEASAAVPPTANAAIPAPSAWCLGFSQQQDLDLDTGWGSRRPGPVSPAPVPGPGKWQRTVPWHLNMSQLLEEGPATEQPPPNGCVGSRQQQHHEAAGKHGKDGDKSKESEPLQSAEGVYRHAPGWCLGSSPLPEQLPSQACRQYHPPCPHPPLQPGTDAPGLGFIKSEGIEAPLLHQGATCIPSWHLGSPLVPDLLPQNYPARALQPPAPHASSQWSESLKPESRPPLQHATAWCLATPPPKAGVQLGCEVGGAEAAPRAWQPPGMTQGSAELADRESQDRLCAWRLCSPVAAPHVPWCGPGAHDSDNADDMNVDGPEQQGEQPQHQEPWLNPVIHHQGTYSPTLPPAAQHAPWHRSDDACQQDDQDHYPLSTEGTSARPKLADVLAAAWRVKQGSQQAGGNPSPQQARERPVHHSTRNPLETAWTLNGRHAAGSADPAAPLGSSACGSQQEAQADVGVGPAETSVGVAAVWRLLSTSDASHCPIQQPASASLSGCLEDPGEGQACSQAVMQGSQGSLGTQVPNSSEPCTSPDVVLGQSLPQLHTSQQALHPSAVAARRTEGGWEAGQGGCGVVKREVSGGEIDLPVCTLIEQLRGVRLQQGQGQGQCHQDQGAGEGLPWEYHHPINHAAGVGAGCSEREERDRQQQRQEQQLGQEQQQQQQQQLGQEQQQRQEQLQLQALVQGAQPADNQQHCSPMPEKSIDDHFAERPWSSPEAAAWQSPSQQLPSESLHGAGEPSGSHLLLGRPASGRRASEAVDVSGCRQPSPCSTQLQGAPDPGNEHPASSPCKSQGGRGDEAGSGSQDDLLPGTPGDESDSSMGGCCDPLPDAALPSTQRHAGLHAQGQPWPPDRDAAAPMALPPERGAVETPCILTQAGGRSSAQAPSLPCTVPASGGACGPWAAFVQSMCFGSGPVGLDPDLGADGADSDLPPGAGRLLQELLQAAGAQACWLREGQLGGGVPCVVCRPERAAVWLRLSCHVLSAKSVLRFLQTNAAPKLLCLSSDVTRALSQAAERSQLHSQAAEATASTVVTQAAARAGLREATPPTISPELPEATLRLLATADGRRELLAEAKQAQAPGWGHGGTRHVVFPPLLLQDLVWTVTQPPCTLETHQPPHAGQGCAREQLDEVLLQASSLMLLLPRDQHNTLEFASIKVGGQGSSRHQRSAGVTVGHVLAAIHAFYQEDVGAEEQLRAIQNDRRLRRLLQDKFVDGCVVTRGDLLGPRCSFSRLARCTRDQAVPIYELELVC